MDVDFSMLLMDKKVTYGAKAMTANFGTEIKFGTEK